MKWICSYYHRFVVVTAESEADARRVATPTLDVPKRMRFKVRVVAATEKTLRGNPVRC